MDREAGKRLLFEIADILEQFGVGYFLMQGTALGAYRDRGFTPTEKDIDVGLLQEHFTPISGQLAAHFIQCGYETETVSLPFRKCRTLVVKGIGAKADIVSFIRWKDKRFASSPRNPHVLKPYSIVHDASVLENYETVELFGRTFNVPSPIETYLEREYGTDWRTPREDHISRTRIYDFVSQNRMPADYLV